jgi:hypothetical protein
MQTLDVNLAYDPSFQRSSLVYRWIQDNWEARGRCVWAETNEDIIFITSAHATVFQEENMWRYLYKYMLREASSLVGH